MLAKYKNIIIIVIVLGLGFVAYTIFKPNPELDSGISVTSGQNVDILGAEITAAINQIASLQLKKDVLQDPLIQYLQDFSEPILDQPVGRRNPFSPLGVGDEGLLPPEEQGTSDLDNVELEDETTE